MAGKLVVLLAMAGVVGGSFCRALAHAQGFPPQPLLYRYLWSCAALGLVATPGYFLLQVGAVSQDGIMGMADPVIGKILLHSGLGRVMGLRMFGFALMLAALWLLYPVMSAVPIRRRSAYVVCTTAVLLLCVSFILTGHISTLSVTTKVLLVLHVLAVFMWIGSLYPLLVLSRAVDIPQVKKLMHSFGVLALGIVGGLLLSGLYLATQVLQTPAELVNTAYGRTLLLKLVGVGALLLLAALNKLVLVPKLLAAGSTSALQTSIKIETGVALGVLVVTSWLTTMTGPAT